MSQDLQCHLSATARLSDAKLVALKGHHSLIRIAISFEKDSGIGATMKLTKLAL